MLRAYIRWLACLRGVVGESTGRTHDHLPKRSDGTGGTPANPNENGGKRSISQCQNIMKVAPTRRAWKTVNLGA